MTQGDGQTLREIGRVTANGITRFETAAAASAVCRFPDPPSFVAVAQFGLKCTPRDGDLLTVPSAQIPRLAHGVVAEQQAERRVVGFGGTAANGVARLDVPELEARATAAANDDPVGELRRIEEESPARVSRFDGRRHVAFGEGRRLRPRGGCDRAPSRRRG